MEMDQKKRLFTAENNQKEIYKLRHDFDFKNVEDISFANQKSKAVTCKKCGTTIFAKSVFSLVKMLKDCSDCKVE